MKLLRTMRKRMAGALGKIHLLDKCLIIIMMILMIQTTYNLFGNPESSAEANTIDVIIHTAASSIFGYFLSVNFIKKTRTASGSVPAPPQNPVIQGSADTAPAQQNQIGFAATDSPAPPQSGHADSKMSPQEGDTGTSHLQIIIAAALAIFSICVLIIFRNFGTVTAAATGAVSQLRDFTSGCVGFLIGCPSNMDTDKK